MVKIAILLIVCGCTQFLATELLEIGKELDTKIRANNILYEPTQVVLNCRTTYLAAKNSILPAMSYQAEVLQYRKINNDLYFVSSRLSQSGISITSSLQDILEIHNESMSYYFVGAGHDTEDVVELAVSFAQQLHEKKLRPHKNQLKLVLFNPEKLNNSQLLNRLSQYFLETNVLSFVYHSMLPLGWPSPIRFGIPIHLGYVSFWSDFRSTENENHWKTRNGFIYLSVCFLSAYWLSKQFQSLNVPSQQSVDRMLTINNTELLRGSVDVSLGTSQKTIDPVPVSDDGIRVLSQQRESITNSSHTNIHHVKENRIALNLCEILMPTIICGISAYMSFKNFNSIRTFPSERSIKMGFQNLIDNYVAFGRTLYDGIGRSPLLS